MFTTIRPALPLSAAFQPSLRPGQPLVSPFFPAKPSIGYPSAAQQPLFKPLTLKRHIAANADSFSKENFQGIMKDSKENLTELLEATKPGSVDRTNKIIDFIEAYSRAAGAAGTKNNNQQVRRILEAAGYKQDDALGLPQAQYKDPAVTARYIVGQFMRLLRIA
jgi:hypothetical protein